MIVAADGSTNVPRPKIAAQAPSAGRDPESADCPVRSAEWNICRGQFGAWPAHWIPWNAKGENLSAQIAYDMTHARYSGDVALGALQVLSLTVQVSGKCCS